MEKATHFLHTWLVAQVIHPVVFTMWVKAEGSDLVLESHLSWIVPASLFSFPAVLILLLLSRLIKKRLLRNGFMFTIWLVSAVASNPFAAYLVAAMGRIDFLFNCTKQLFRDVFANKTS